MRRLFNRRGLLTGAAALASLAASGARAGAGGTMAYVGSYTPEGHGIFQYRFDPRTGALAPVALAAQMTNPSWIAVDQARGRLFASSETHDYGPGQTGSVTAFAINPATGGLTRLNTVSSGGAGPAHISVHPSGRFVLVANYDGGNVAVLGVGANGALAGPLDIQASSRPSSATTPDPAQSRNLALSDHTAPHMHMVAADPSGRFVAADDAGSDQVNVWRIDMATGRLTPAPSAATNTPAGSAPRHFVFTGDGRRLFNLQEHDGMLKSYSFSPSSGALSLDQTLPVLHEGYAGSSLASELVLSPSGRFLYAGERLRNTITTVAVDHSGRMRKVGETWTQGDHPRSFSVDPTGRFLICCNQRSDNLTTFKVDPASGALTFTGRFDAIGSPAVIVFHQLG